MKKALFYMAAVALLISIAAPAMAERDGKGFPPHRGKLFERMDTDSDGTVTKEEFLKNAEKHFSELDTDNNGKITREEIEHHHEMMKEKFKKHKEQERKE